jgi:hypothetical protein
MAEKTDKKIDINALGQVMDTSWTRSGASSGPVLSTHSVKAKFTSDNQIRVMYVTVVNMVRDRDLKESCNIYEKEADTIIEATVKKIATDYKEITDQSIKFKRTTIDSNVEIIDLNHFNQKRSAYFRRVAVFEIA